MLLAPVAPSNPGTHTLSRSLGMTVTVGPESPLILEDLVRANTSMAVDIETYGLGLRARDIKIVTFATASHAVILDIRRPTHAESIRWAFSQLETMIFHNSAFDVTNLAAAGHWRPEWSWKVSDTLIYARLAEPSVLIKKTVEACAERYLGMEKSQTSMNQIFRELGLTIKDGWQRFDLDRPVYVYGAATDAITTARLLPAVRQAAYERLTSGHPWVGTQYGVSGAEAWKLVDREQILNRLFLARSAKGLRIDGNFADLYHARTLTEYGRAVSELHDSGIEPGKARQLVEYLDGIGAISEDYPRTTTGMVSTTADNLEKRLNHPLARAYVTAKQIDHVRKDYLAKCLELELGGRIFPEVNILAAVTGRMSMGNPPIHQFPGAARGIIMADEGDSFTSIDWSQIEPVLAANMAKDHDILTGYENGSTDLYAAIAERAQVTRKTAKVILLAQLYGEGITKLALDLGVSIEAAKDLRESIFATLPRVKRLIGNMRQLAERHRMVFSLSGRIMPIPSGLWGVDTHKGINYLIQGSAYDLMADALVRVVEAGLADTVYLALHDELVVSTQAAEDVRRIMARPPTRLIEIAQRTPVLRTDLLDLGSSWAVA